MTGDLRDVVIVAMHDGFYGSGTGAGQSNRAFLRVLCDVLNPHVQLVAMPIHLDAISPEYDDSWHKDTLTLLDRTVDAKIVPVDNGTFGATRFGGLANFRQASAQAATVIPFLIGRAPQSLVVAIDAPFFGLSPLLPANHAARVVNVARATAALHAPGQADRLAWERDGLLATTAAGGHVAATSRHVRDHLTDAYGIEQRLIVDLINGLLPAETGHAGRAKELLPPEAEHGFLLAFGRAEPYKGWDDLLDSLLALRNVGLPIPHLVLGAVTESGPLTPYQQHLADRIETEPLDVTLRTTFHPGFRGLLAHPKLAGVIVPSRAEPFGRIPLEAIQAGASPIVATTAGGLAEIVIEEGVDGGTGFSAEPGDPASLAAAIMRALSANREQRQRLLLRGRELAMQRFDYRVNVTSFLECVAPWAVCRQST